MSWSNQPAEPVYVSICKDINGLKSSRFAWITYLSDKSLVYFLHQLSQLSLIEVLPQSLDNFILRSFTPDLLVLFESKEGCDLIMQYLNKHLRVKESGRVQTSSKGGKDL